MKKFFVTIFVVTLVFGLTGMADVYAFNYTDNITISDLQQAGSDWRYGKGVGYEDQEVEPQMLTGQKWDLEAFFLDGTDLAMVGGFNFVAGEEGWQSGDLFISTDGAPQYGDDNYIPSGYDKNSKTAQDTFGYEYVLQLNFTTKKYNLIDLTQSDDVVVKLSHYQSPAYNRASDPWRYVSGGVTLEPNLDFSYQTGLTGNQVGGLYGGNTFSGSLTTSDHNVAIFDLRALEPFGLNLFNPQNDVYFHFTMQCGNDNLMGHYDPIPEPGTLLLLGAGLIGLLAFGRKRIKK